MVYIFILGKILFGGYFMRSGYNHIKNLGMLTGYAQSKGVPAPKLAVFVTGLMMLFGGLGLIFGPYTQLATLMLVVFLVPTTIMMHQYWKIADPMQRMSENVNFYKNVALIGALLMLFYLVSSL